ncbi:MAG TPA: MBL fold metallo-hydrolase [Actinopolymorphaceae bacterium]
MTKPRTSDPSYDPSSSRQSHDQRWQGGPVGDCLHCVVAPNPGPLTLDGTNTWVLHRKGSSEALVVDPGPDDESHLEHVLDVVRKRGAKVTQALVTHRHDDHTGGARRFAERTGCPVRAYDPDYCVGDARPLEDREVLTVDGLELRVLATPGHTTDSVSFLLSTSAGEPRTALFTGDTVLGRGTAVVAHPDGALAPYLDSLERLRDLVSAEGVQLILPGHGPVRDDPLAVLDGYLSHRAERLVQVHRAFAAGARTPREIVERVYADIDPVLWPAAEQSVRAQLDYLAEAHTRDRRTT